MIGPVRSLVGAPAPAIWEALECLARRALGPAPDDPEALLLACRASAQRGHAPEALALLRGHVAARASASPAALERALGDIARGEPAVANDALLALAREQLRWGDFEAARRTLCGLAGRELPAPLEYRRCILSAEALVRAGDVQTCAAELGSAWTRAARELRDEALRRACARAGVSAGLARLRESLGAVLARDAFIDGPDGRCRIAPGVRVAVRRSWPPGEGESEPRAVSAK